MTYVNGFTPKQKYILFTLFLAIFSCEQAPTPTKKFMVARVYNAATRDGEAAYLNAMDKSNLPQDFLDAVKARQEELEEIKAALDAIPAIALNIARCLPVEGRVPPPLPCPLSEDLQVPIPVGTQIELDLVGVFQDIPGNPGTRVEVEQGSAVLLTTDGKKVFAEGSLNSYDNFFQTAWYHFDVKNPALSKKPLILRVTTVVVINQQSQPVVIEIPVPPSMFLADNLY
ncbi:MAG TPA: hypothetical protein VFZ52_00545 [Chryseolinea sp.]